MFALASKQFPLGRVAPTNLKWLRPRRGQSGSLPITSVQLSRYKFVDESGMTCPQSDTVPELLARAFGRGTSLQIPHRPH